MMATLGNIAKFAFPKSSVYFSVKYASTAVQSSKELRWDLIASVCIERPPYITPKLTGIEDSVNKLLQVKELEESMLNDHELKHK